MNIGNGGIRRGEIACICSFPYAYKCRKCGWRGLVEDCIVKPNKLEIVCSKCDHVIDRVKDRVALESVFEDEENESE